MSGPRDFFLFFSQSNAAQRSFSLAAKTSRPNQMWHRRINKAENKQITSFISGFLSSVRRVSSTIAAVIQPKERGRERARERICKSAHNI
jgi:hypothetical protein